MSRITAFQLYIPGLEINVFIQASAGEQILQTEHFGRPLMSLRQYDS